MIIRFLTYIILTIGLNLICHSQDIHFSQFNLSPLNLNPAMTGAFKGDYRFAETNGLLLQFRIQPMPYPLKKTTV